MLAHSWGVHLRATPSWSSNDADGTSCAGGAGETGAANRAHATTSSRGCANSPVRYRPVWRESVAPGPVPDDASPPPHTRRGGGCGLHARPACGPHPRHTHRGPMGRRRCEPGPTSVPGLDIRCTSGWAPPRSRPPSLPASGSGNAGPAIGTDIDPPAGESRRQPSVLSLSPDCQRELVVGNEYPSRLRPRVHHLD